MGLGRWLQNRSAGRRKTADAAGPELPAVFISYRRYDSPDIVRRIHKAYCRLYSPSSIFLDTQDIRAGAAFPDLLRKCVRNASVVLVVIGPRWPVERLTEAGDWVRQEIKLALQAGARVIPVLVDGAAMPAEARLPKDVRALTTRNNFPLSEETFTTDVQALLNEIGVDVGGVSELNAWRETSLFNSGIGAGLFRRVQQGLTAPEALAIYGDKAGWYDAALNAELLDRSLAKRPLAFNRLPDEWLAHGAPADAVRRRYAIERKLAAGAFIANDPKIRLASDIAFPLAEPVAVQETDYVSSLMTDQMAFVRVSRDETILYHETDRFLAFQGGAVKLLPFSETGMSNQIGASTLAFTRDGYLVFVQQTANNAQSGGTLAPSGSGSLDLEDLAYAAGDDLLDVVRHGAARELVEECGLQGRLTPEAVARTELHVFAFARMLHRGGKPEFFCVARLPYTADEIHAAMPTRHETRFTQHSESASTRQIDMTKDIRAEIVRVCSHFSQAATDRIDAQALKLSYPLHHALDLLAEALATPSPRAQALADFVAAGLRE